MGVGKDYANKGRPRKKAAPKQSNKRSTARKSPASAPKRPLKLMIAAAIMLVALGYLLSSLLNTQTPSVAKHSPLAPPSQQTQPAPQKPAAAKAQTTEKPTAKPTLKAPSPQPSTVKAPTEPRFEFYQMLPDSEVTTSDPTAYKSTPKDQAAAVQYLLQAGSFRTAADADRVRAQLLLSGLPNVHVSSTTNDSGTTWYRVRTGPFLNRTTLKQGRVKLESQGITPLAIKAE